MTRMNVITMNTLPAEVLPSMFCLTEATWNFFGNFLVLVTVTFLYEINFLMKSISFLKLTTCEIRAFSWVCFSVRYHRVVGSFPVVIILWSIATRFGYRNERVFWRVKTTISQWWNWAHLKQCNNSGSTTPLWNDPPKSMRPVIWCWLVGLVFGV